MSELTDLYQEVILEHGKKPRNFEAMPDYDRMANGHNPLCGDKLTVFAKVRDGKIHKVSFCGSGCAISVASASLMSEMLVGRSLDEAQTIFQAFHDLVTGKADTPEIREKLEKLVVFEGVRAFPVRVKCATLAWHTMRAALDEEQTPVSTE